MERKGQDRITSLGASQSPTTTRSVVKVSESRESQHKDVLNVKFILDSGQTFASAYKRNTTIGEIREKLADVLDSHLEAIKLHHDELGKLSDTFTLNNILNELTITTKVRLESTVGECAIIEEKIRENIPSMDVITVHTCVGEGFPNKDFTISIENQCCQKEWLGGFRHKATGVEYHNAFCQTKPKVRRVFDSSEWAMPLAFHRDTQTPHRLQEQNVGTGMSRGTQMWRWDLYIPSQTDRVITAGPYQPYTGRLTSSRAERAAVVIQRAVRDYLASSRILALIRLERQQAEEKRRQKAELKRAQELKEQRILTSTVYPSKRDDFYVLYLLIEKWLEKDSDRIDAQRGDITRKACNYVLLMKEINYLFAIEKHKVAVKKESLKKLEVRFLELTSRPKTFKNTKGQITSIDDLDTQRARELKEIYSELTNLNRAPVSRLEFLMVFREQFNSQYSAFEYTPDLISLVNREIDLITIGTKSKDLKGLRARIEQLYLHFLHQEEFNPKVEKYKKPNWPKTVSSLFQCYRCNKLLPPSQFPVHVRMKTYVQCTSCQWIQNIGHNRVDMSPFLKLLRQVQRAEMQMCCHSAVCFLLQKIGMAYLTNVIWHGRSAISECKVVVLLKLRHVRWLEDIEWAPWNTILLTDHEAKCHASIPNVFQFYDQSFINKVCHRHMMARIHFKDLLKMDHYLSSTGAWQTINDSGPYFHSSHADMFAVQNDYDDF